MTDERASIDDDLRDLIAKPSWTDKERETILGHIGDPEIERALGDRLVIVPQRGGKRSYMLLDEIDA